MEIVQCSVCGRGFSEDAVIKAGEYRVCADCKPVFLQRLREGVPLSQELRYGGFWIRVGAQIIDVIILWIVSFIVGLAAGYLGGRTGSVAGFLSFVINMGYATYFVGAYGATLGKMACGLKVVRPGGEKLTYARAFGRYWATFLSSLILCIGFIMVAFDAEKRGLHDRICDTRVVKA
jgi:uncharacterized RDD family membrane protein YckC